jgi:hypothetical protein
VGIVISDEDAEQLSAWLRMAAGAVVLAALQQLVRSAIAKRVKQGAGDE